MAREEAVSGVLGDAGGAAGEASASAGALEQSAPAQTAPPAPAVKKRCGLWGGQTVCLHERAMCLPREFFPLLSRYFD